MKGRKNRTQGVIGVDEVGRGPLAGPVTVCAVYIEDEKALLKDVFQNTIRDSKKINKVLRNNIYLTIRHKRYLKTNIEYAIFSRSAAYIDKHGISKATRECSLACLKSLKRKGVRVEDTPIRLDAGLRIPMESLKQESFIKGDERFAEIALASILAKEHRDAYMRRIAKAFDSYAWHVNAGYGTERHRDAIQKYGITKHHRITYLKGFKHFDKADNI